MKVVSVALELYTVQLFQCFLCAETFATYLLLSKISFSSHDWSSRGNQHTDLCHKYSNAKGIKWYNKNIKLLKVVIETYKSLKDFMKVACQKYFIYYSVRCCSWWMIFISNYFKYKSLNYISNQSLNVLRWCTGL